MNDQQIIEEFSDYIRNSISVYNQTLDGPVCPFALSALQNDKVKYIVLHTLYPSFMVGEIQEWLSDPEQVLIFIQRPSGTGQHKLWFLEWLCVYLERCFDGVIECFAGHPQSEYRFRDVLTRQDPYVNVQVNRINDLQKARELLIVRED